MKKAFDKEELIAGIPQINQIQNGDWKEKVLQAWELAYNDSPFEDLKSIRFSPFYPAPTLLEHTRTVTQASMGLAEVMKDAYGYDIDMDVVIVVAALHDISKLRENEPDEAGGIRKSSLGKMYQHAFFSAHYAVQVGLPDKIVAAIFAHTGNTKQLPTSLEGIIVTYGDMTDADMHRFVNDRPLHIAKIHKG